MKEFYIADTHFAHTKIIKYENRPFSTVKEMNETLINNWNHVVAPTDMVWHLGDFGFGSFEDISLIVARLNGYKILIMGNHDLRWGTRTKWLKTGFNEVYKKSVVRDDCILSHAPIPETNICNIHGHSHSRIAKLTPNHTCVSVEVINYRPIMLF